MIRVLVDSSSDLTQQDCRKLGLEFVPLQVQIKGMNYSDGVDLKKDDFYTMLVETKEFPKTSQPTPQTFLDVFEDVKAKGDSLICLLLASALSGTIQSARMAKDLVDYDSIYILDTCTAVAGIRILIEEAMRQIKAGNAFEDIISNLEALKSRVRIYAAVDTLDYLVMGGRVSKAAAAIGSLAKLKPIITVSQEGNVEVMAKRIGINKSISCIVENSLPEKVDTNYSFYSLCSYGDVNVSKMEKKLQDANVSICGRVQIGPSIGAHIGPEAFGVCYIEKK